MLVLQTYQSDCLPWQHSEGNIIKDLLAVKQLIHVSTESQEAL